MKNAEVYDEQLIATEISEAQNLPPRFQACGATEIQACIPQNLHVNILGAEGWETRKDDRYSVSTGFVGNGWQCVTRRVISNLQ